ncbi:MAG TPA: MFS transporter [Syntrophales bacterium]|nr:MFS transporter [Syntrophales bacterium]
MLHFKTYRWVLLGIIAILYFFVCLQRLSPSVVARDLALALHADAVLLGIIASAYFYLYSAMQPVVGYLSDTKGPRKVMALSFLIAAAGTILFGMAPNATAAIVGRTLIGAGLAGVFIPALKVFSRWYRPDQFAGLTGIMITIGGIGGLSAALPLTYLVVLLGWRGAFLAIGLLSAVLAVLAWFIVRDSPEDRGWPPLMAQGGGGAVPETKMGEIGLSKRLGTVFGDLDFWLISIASFLAFGASLSFQGLWAVPYLMDVFHLDRVRAGWVLTAMPLGFSIGGPAVGFLADRLHLNRKKVLLWAIGLSILGWLLLMAFQDLGYLVPVVPLFFFFGLAAGGMLPLFFTITRDIFPLWLMGTATGLMNTSAFFGTAVYQPFTGLLLNDAASTQPGSYSFDAYRMLLIVYLISYGGAFLAMCFLSKRGVRPPSGGAAETGRHPVQPGTE